MFVKANSAKQHFTGSEEGSMDMLQERKGCSNSTQIVIKIDGLCID